MGRHRGRVPEAVCRLSAALLVSAFAAVAAAGEVKGHITDRKTGRPVPGALVHVSGPGGLQHVVTTDGAGRYRLELGAGTYRLLIVYGMSQSKGSVSLGADDRLVLDDQVDSALGEVIVIEERRRPVRPRLPAVLPVARNYSRVKAPPYSDTAILSDAWTRAWLLLDVDETGGVNRFKFLKRPGHDLEKIATREALKLRFEPARDASSRRACRVRWRPIRKP